MSEELKLFIQDLLQTFSDKTFVCDRCGEIQFPALMYEEGGDIAIYPQGDYVESPYCTELLCTDCAKRVMN